MFNLRSLNLKQRLKSPYYLLRSFGQKIGHLDTKSLILNYHHIINEPNLPKNLLYGYSHRLISFEAQLKWLSSNFNFTSDFEQPGVVITFDDCSKATFEDALPILEKYGIKAHFYVVEAELGKVIWVDKYFGWLSYIPKGVYDILSARYMLDSHQSRLRANEQIWEHIKSGLTGFKLLEILNEVYPFSRLSKEFEKQSKRMRCIDEHDINRLKSAGHHIGFHSRSHAWLSSLNDESLKDECTTLRSSLYNCDNFAIPFGFKDAYNDKVISFLLNNGFSHILLNHAHKKGNGLYGRLNLPDTTNIREISVKTFSYLNYIE